MFKKRQVFLSLLYIMIAANIAAITLIVLQPPYRHPPLIGRRTIEALDATNHFIETSIVQTTTATSTLATIAKTETPGWLLDQPGVP